MINCCSQSFSWNLSNVSLYVHLQINQRSNMSLVDMILQVFPQPEVTWIQVRRSCRPRIWKTSGDNAFICEGFTKQTLNLATDMWWCPIQHKNSGLNTVTFLQGRKHTLHKDVFVTCRHHSTLNRSPWCNSFKEKRATNKGACESRPHNHVTQNAMAVDALQAV